MINVANGALQNVYNKVNFGSLDGINAHVFHIGWRSVAYALVLFISVHISKSSTLCRSLCVVVLKTLLT